MSPPPITIWLVRHAESEANVSSICASRIIDPPLTVKGREDAILIAEALAQERISSLTSSPLLRSKQTADVIAHRAGLRVSFLADLQEVDVGSLDGRSLTASENVRIYEDIMSRWSRGESGVRFEKGESLGEVWERAERVLAALSSDPGHDRVVIVSHAGFLMVFLPFLLGEFPPQLERYHVPTGSITRAVLSHGMAQIEVLGSTEHLQ